MSEPIGDDPLERLRRANPVDAERLPSASLARVRARFQEEFMTEPGIPSRPGSGRLRLGIGAVAGAVLLSAVVALIPSPAVAPGPLPSLSGGAISAASRAPTFAASGGHISASCVETYTLDSLGRRSFAFDGTVVAIEGRQEVTFDVNEVFRGAASNRITLTAMGMTPTVISSLGGPTLMPGGRYLVAGDDHFVWACGFTQEYDPAVAASWKATLGD